MAKKKAKSAKPAKKTKKAIQKKAKPAKKITRKKAAPAKKGAASKKVKRAKAAPAKKVKRAKPAPAKAKPAKAQSTAYHVRIDHVTQGPDGHETPADRLSIHSDDFLWIYVEADLPAQAVPQGEYYQLDGGSAARIPLDPPIDMNGQFRFGVLHFVLAPQSKYSFHFADNLGSPTYEDRWEIVTV